MKKKNKEATERKRRYEVEMGLELLRVLSHHRNGLPTKLLLKESNVNHDVLKRTEPYMMAAGLLTRKKEGASLLYRTNNRSHKVLREYARISSYFTKNSGQRIS